MKRFESVSFLGQYGISGKTNSFQTNGFQSNGFETTFQTKK